MPDLTRRSVLAGACATCAAALSGCATYTSGSASPTPAVPVPATAAPPPTSVSAEPSTEPSTEASAEPSENAPATPPGLAATTDIPVGGGKIFKDQGLVITQPVAGTFLAFSSRCTHQGCAVGSVTDRKIVCNCHGSYFDIADGSVLDGPASSPLPERAISVRGGQINPA